MRDVREPRQHVLVEGLGEGELHEGEATAQETRLPVVLADVEGLVLVPLLRSIGGRIDDRQEPDEPAAELDGRREVVPLGEAESHARLEEHEVVVEQRAEDLVGDLILCHGFAVGSGPDLEGDATKLSLSKFTMPGGGDHGGLGDE